MKARVLFLCVGNSARSQMAEGFLRAHHGDRYEAASAGSQPTQVNPLAVAVMAEVGVDISAHRSKDVRQFSGQRFDYVVTLCGEDAAGACPFFPGGGISLHHPFPDPVRVEGADEERRAAFRRVRDAVGEWVDVTFAGGPTPTGKDGQV